jgi:hypothetical protein
VKNSFSFAMTIVGTLIGAGFATGQELFSFFILRGGNSYIYFFISVMMMLLSSLIIYIYARNKNIRNIDNLFYKLFGTWGASLFTLIITLFLFSCFTVTAAGAGVLFEENILDKDGKPLHCNTHRFRSTFATNLLQSGVEPNSVSKMLGQKCSDSVYYYIDVTDKEKQSYLKPRLEADQVLITNLGKLDDKVLSDYENPIPLCNGWCVKNSAFGVCKKANHCISCDAFVPTFAHIASYERQLQEIEATIAISKANCMQLMLNNALKTKESLEKILKKLYEKGGHV